MWQGLVRARPEPHSPLGRPRELLLRLSEGWESYCLHRRGPTAPATDNGGQQAIGRFRVRARAMRGIQSWAGLEAALLLPHLKAALRRPAPYQAQDASVHPFLPKIANRRCDSNISRLMPESDHEHPSNTLKLFFTFRCKLTRLLGCCLAWVGVLLDEFHETVDPLRLWSHCALSPQAAQLF